MQWNVQIKGIIMYLMELYADHACLPQSIKDFMNSQIYNLENVLYTCVL